jgi:hypothetical protein
MAMPLAEGISATLMSRRLTSVAVNDGETRFKTRAA